MEFINSIKTETTYKYLWIATFMLFLIWSGINPKETGTWILETVPAIIAFGVLIKTFNSFRLTSILYILILAHSIVLMIGGHYTYAEVPFFNYLKDVFELSRNNYDKLGHFMQGFVPAMVAREIILRKNIINGKSYQVFFIITCTLAISAFYELIEWLVAILAGGGAEAFLGTQGYEWDTQSDMAVALLGSIIALLFMSKLHDRQLEKINS